MPETFYTKQIGGGITLLGQPMENVSSAAITIVAPAGASRPTRATGR